MMQVDPAAGKILGMLMAYAVSSLGLLLAYYNYRKRILKADRIFSPVATAVIIGVITVAVIGAVLTAAVASSDADGLWPAVTSNIVGLALPAFILLVSVVLTWALFRHFSRRMPGAGPSD
jgi:xanthine/uracil permease